MNLCHCSDFFKKLFYISVQSINRAPLPDITATKSETAVLTPHQGCEGHNGRFLGSLAVLHYSHFKAGNIVLLYNFPNNNVGAHLK